MNTHPLPDRKDGLIVIVGSLNMDLVMRTARLPEGGETLHGHEFSTLPGGKGANQAVACARLGGKVSMIGQVGADSFGQTLREGLRADGVNVQGVKQTDAAATGVAMILVEDIGQNRILLASGANGALTPADLEAQATVIERASMLIVQLEIPLPVVERAIALAHAAGVPVLLNPAPAVVLPDTIWPQIDFLVPNESEASLLSGIKVKDIASAFCAARIFRGRGVACVLITLGEQGVVVVDAAGERHFTAQLVKAVDSTAAGDTFIGGLAASLVNASTLDEAVALAQRASALCVQRHGAQPSIPYRHEIN